MNAKEIAFRNFIKDTEKLISVIEFGHTLDSLAVNCKCICGEDVCTASSYCTMKQWIILLQEAKREDFIPSELLTFLQYIIAPQSSHRTFGSIAKHMFLKFRFFLDFECVKSKIVEDLEYGFSLKSIINDASDYENSKLLLDWALFLTKADERDLIPGGDLLYFLKFI